MQTDLIDSIYEAAFVPERWNDALDGLAANSGSAAASLLIYRDADRPPLYRTTALTQPGLEAYVESGGWRDQTRTRAMFDADDFLITMSRFFYVCDFLPETAGDPVDRALNRLGLEAQITTLIPMNTGPVITFTLERRHGEGRHSASQIEWLDLHRPHLARAALITERLEVERATAVVAGLEALNMPAAVISSAGRAIATNALLEQMHEVFRSGAFGRLSLAEPRADALLQQAVNETRIGMGANVRSIPVAGCEGTAPSVVHILPLRGAARDIFSGGEMVLVVSHFAIAQCKPDLAVIGALFDLAPAEARLAATLAQGRPLAEAAIGLGISYATARTYLQRIFEKTGTHRQPELVLLLQGVSRFGPKSPAPASL